MSEDYDDVFVDLLIFGGVECSSCHRVLPKTPEHFVVDRTQASGLTLQCRACRSAAHKRSDSTPERRARKAELQRLRYAADPAYAERRREAARRTALRRKERGA